MKKYKIIINKIIELEVDEEEELPFVLEMTADDFTPEDFIDSTTVIDIESGRTLTKSEVAKLWDIEDSRLN